MYNICISSIAIFNEYEKSTGWSTCDYNGYTTSMLSIFFRVYSVPYLREMDENSFFPPSFHISATPELVITVYHFPNSTTNWQKNMACSEYLNLFSFGGYVV